MEDLTDRQRAVLEFIVAALREKGYPPSIREIGAAVGLASPSSVQAQLASLQRKGYIRRDPTKPRAMEVKFDGATGAQAERRPVRFVPLVGDIAAGRPILAEESIEDAYPVPADWVGDDGALFMLRVRGDSMIDAGICDGDYVVVRQGPDALDGEIVAALVGDDEATVKRFYRKGTTIVLRPENPTLQDMVFEDGVEILGKVVTVIRSI